MNKNYTLEYHVLQAKNWQFSSIKIHKIRSQLICITINIAMATISAKVFCQFVSFSPLGFLLFIIHLQETITLQNVRMELILNNKAIQSRKQQRLSSCQQVEFTVPQKEMFNSQLFHCNKLDFHCVLLITTISR